MIFFDEEFSSIIVQIGARSTSRKDADQQRMTGEKWVSYNNTKGPFGWLKCQIKSELAFIVNTHLNTWLQLGYQCCM